MTHARSCSHKHCMIFRIASARAVLDLITSNMYKFTSRLTFEKYSTWNQIRIGANLKDANPFRSSGKRESQLPCEVCGNCKMGVVRLGKCDSDWRKNWNIKSSNRPKSINVPKEIILGFHMNFFYICFNI